MSTVFTCRITMQPQYELGEEILLSFELTNQTNDDYYILKWYTPFEGLITSQFNVTKDGYAIEYDGVFVSRGHALQNSYILVPANGTMTATVDLSYAYSIVEIGQYSVRLETMILDYVKKEDFSSESRPLEQYINYPLESDVIHFEVLEGTTPRQTIGNIARDSESTQKDQKKEINNIGQYNVIPPKIISRASVQIAALERDHYAAYHSLQVSLQYLSRIPILEYITWFGAYDKVRFATVVENYKKMSNALTTNQFTYNCIADPQNLCPTDVIAYTYQGLFTIYFCVQFFELPYIGEPRKSQVGILIEELSHAVCLTDDLAYPPEACQELAKKYPEAAIHNGPSYSYFSEVLFKSINLGGFYTASMPFIPGDGYIYFQGIDNKLWRVNLANPQPNFGGFQTKSTPFVGDDNCIYFQGTDDKLWQVNTNNSQQAINLGNCYTTSMPFAPGDGYVYFKGLDKELWQVDINSVFGITLGNFQIASAPFVKEDYVYFQGTDNKLWKVDINSEDGTKLGGFQTASTPFVKDDNVYFQGTDNTLWKVNINSGEGTKLGNFEAKSAPFVKDNYVYIQATDDELWQVDINSGEGTPIDIFKTKSTPFVKDNYIYFQGTNNKLWKVDINNTRQHIIFDLSIGSTPFIPGKDFIYCQGSDNKLWQFPI